MRITKEEFNKLPQLDRIEYRQRREEIKKHLFKIGFYNLLNPMCVIIGFFILLVVIMFDKFPIDLIISFLTIIPSLIKLTLYGSLFIIFIDFFFLLINKKELNKLDEEYFKKEIKIKNDKRKRRN